MTQEGRVRYVHTQSRPQCVGTAWEPPSHSRTPSSLSLQGLGSAGSGAGLVHSAFSLSAGLWARADKLLKGQMQS